MITFHFNEIYQQVFTTEKRIIDIHGGRGRGGSHFGTNYFLYLLTQPAYFRGYFIRKTLNDIKTSLFQDIKDRIEENPDLDIKDFHINENNYSLTYRPTGNMIISKGVTGSRGRTAKMKSLAGATHVLIEEADELDEQSFSQLNLSLRTVKSEKIQIVRIYNQPPRNHWIYKDYNLIETDIKGYFFAEVKGSSDILSVFSTCHDNIKNLHPSTIREFEAFKDSDPDYYYNQILGLVGEGAKGRIYSGWEHISDVEYDALELPHIYVVDFGYGGAPTAVIDVKYHKDLRYVRELIYSCDLDSMELARQMRAKGIDESALVIADYGSGGSLRIAELRRGTYDGLVFNIRSTVKGGGSVQAGISKVKATKIYMTESSLNGWNEYMGYCWLLDANKNPTEQPKKENDHIMDCIRYAELYLAQMNK